MAALSLLAGGCASVLPPSAREAVGGERFAAYTLEELGELCLDPDRRYVKAVETAPEPPHTAAVFLRAPGDDTEPDRFELMDLEGETTLSGRRTVSGWTPGTAEEVELLACVEGQGADEEIGECTYQDTGYSSTNPTMRTVPVYSQRFTVTVRELATGAPVYERTFELRNEPQEFLGTFGSGICPGSLTNWETTEGGGEESVELPTEIYSVPGGRRVASELWETVEGGA